MNRIYLLLVLALVFGCIEAPMSDGDQSVGGDEDSPRSGFVDLIEIIDTPDLDDGRSDAEVVPGSPVEENPYPNGRDAPPPLDMGIDDEEDTGYDENGRSPEDIANRSDLG